MCGTTTLMGPRNFGSFSSARRAKGNRATEATQPTTRQMTARGDEPAIILPPEMRTWRSDLRRKELPIRAVTIERLPTFGTGRPTLAYPDRRVGFDSQWKSE